MKRKMPLHAQREIPVNNLSDARNVSKIRKPYVSYFSGLFGAFFDLLP